MRYFILLFTLIYSVNISSQINFEKGYFITNENIKTECLIKNYNWINIPNEIEYKFNETSEILKGDIIEINEFKIYNTDHYYKKLTFLFDFNEKGKEENIKRITSFLKVLVEGKTSLYQYNGNTYLYQNNFSEIKQLVYKKYINDKNIMFEDFNFRKEIYNNLRCKENTTNIRSLKYKKKDLINFFKNYNICQNEIFEIFPPKRKKTKFLFNIHGGIGTFNSKAEFIGSYTFSSPITNDVTYTGIDNIDFGNNTSTNFGFETEIILPIHRYKWSFFISPNYNILKASNYQKFDYLYGSTYDLNIKINNTYFIEIPIGFKHYFYFNKNSKFNLGMGYNLIYLTNGDDLLEIKNIDGISAQPSSNDITSSNYISIVTGYSYKEKFSISLNYYPTRKLNQENFKVNIDNSILLLLKYNFL